MKKITLLFIATILTSGMSACSDKNNDTPPIVKTKELPTIGMVSTHAIDLDISVSQLTFVPNSAAPWLGRIILLDDAGNLYSTDIEGRAPKPVGTGKYIDVFGLAREAAPGVFLAITENNKIEAFIESDNVGNFSQMIYSGKDIKALALCGSIEPISDYAKILNTGAGFHAVDLRINGTQIEQAITDSTQAPEETRECKIDQKAWQMLEFQYDFIFEAGTPNIKTVSLFGGEVINEVNINNGLSVRGVEHVKFIATTKSNYGGGAYANGVIALVDADEDRIVFISLSYAKRQLLNAVNPPEDVPQ